ncbi:hypothetical protein BKA63DRAFT_577199 [Paraphoma chrysanthemicola]|nr:hypothetical protein BKA63DRAFT_577199 [Paraphoma chrysanthemicola]
MASSQNIQEAHEEHPDGAKELYEKAQSRKGEFVEQEVSRDSLLQEHSRHFKFQTESNFQPRKFILPMPYCPSRTPLTTANWTRIGRLRIASRDPNEAIVLRTVTGPVVHSSSVTIVEDEHGDVARLTVCNLEDSMLDPILPAGSVLVVKQPCWAIALNGGYYIRIDQPSDLVVLDPNDTIIPPHWENDTRKSASRTISEWKKEGDSMFLKKKFRQALTCYERGRCLFNPDTEDAVQIDMLRKCCGVNIVLLRFDQASEDLAQGIATYCKTDSALQELDLADTATAKRWLHNRNVEASVSSTRLPRPLRDLANRLRFDIGIYQQNADYELAKLSSAVGPLSLHIDAASYISDTEIKQTPHHGRGLFARCDFRAGDLIMAEKAFAMPGYIINDRNSECSLYSLGDGTAADRAGALLFKELIQKLTANPSLRPSFFDMDDGGYWKENGWEVSKDEDIPVDVFRVEHIRRRNCFAAPIRSVDVLTRPTPVRNGFWIHTSYINHSCLPNSVRTFLGDLLLLRATRDIAAGEEITAQYVAPELAFKDRQHNYQSTWGFECDCELCKVDSKAGTQVEQERAAIFEELKTTAQKLGGKPTVTALKKFAKRLRELEALYDEDAYSALPKLCLVHPTLFLTEAWRGLKNTDRTIDSATRLLRYFGIEVRTEGDEFRISRNSGMVNVECVRALKYLAEGYTSKGRAELASSIMRTAETWFRIITGTDIGSEEFLQG